MKSALNRKMSELKAVLFDLDGVLVPTAAIHMRAWQALFDEVFSAKGWGPAYTDADYYAYVDGKSRYDGVGAVLVSRGVELPWGNPQDPGDVFTVCGLANRKNEVFHTLLDGAGVEAYPEAHRVLSSLAKQGKKVAVVSSSANARQVLASTGLLCFFECVVDGVVCAERGFPGKPAPDSYWEAARALGCEPEECAVVEDALSGVQAGHAGGFALVVGVDRGVGEQSLRDAGADEVVTWLDPLAPFDPLDRDRFPVDEWKLVERGVEGDRAVSATLFSLANGYIGVRGDGDGTRGLGHGTFVNGFHETFRIHHAEQAYGFASVGQVIQGVPDAVAFEIQLWPCGVTVDSLGGATDCGQSECRSAMASDVVRLSAPESTTQEVDFRTGVWTRTAIHTTVLGRVQVEEQRMVCLANRHLVVASVEVTPLDSPCHVSVRSLLDDVVSAQERSDSLDPREADTVQEGGLDLNQSRTDDVRTLSSYHCLNSRLGISVGTHAEKTLSTSTRVVTYVAYHGDEVPPTGVVDCLAVVGDQDPTSREADCARTLDWACSQGWDAIAASQETYLADFWERADVIVDTGDETTGPIQQATRWALFQLAQASAQVQGHGISAKGLSGSGYSGHYFWDTELFVVPFLTYTNPTAAKAVLEFRHAMLPAARRRAAEMDVAGALFPWRTINGEEASAYYPAGTAQYHIDADIAYAVSQYVGVTGDTRFLVGQGLDILVETARMWVDLGFYGDDGYFHIHGVTGPDEYSAVVDDNFYTNAMAKFALEAAVRAATARQTTSQSEDLISVESAVASAESGSTLSGPVDCGEVESWAKAAAAMCLPVADGIHPQDSHFLTRESWDLAALSKDPRPLLLRYHPLVIYRHKVLKQSDVVLALHLLSDWFTPEEKAADFAYYEPLTTGDSTLSVCTQTVIAAEVGREDLALEHLRDALFVDLANFHGNTGSGVHIACAGGVWTALVAGFGGLRDCGTKPALSPRLPSSWKSLTFPLRIGESQVRVRVTHEGAQVTVVSGDDVDLPVA